MVFQSLADAIGHDDIIVAVRLERLLIDLFH